MTELRNKMRVLVVDDERLIADSLAMILNCSGFDTTAVYSGEEAVETANLMKPHVVISDIAMGKMTGIEAATRIRQAVPGCRIILFSGQAATMDLASHSLADRHHFEILVKPVHPRVFIQRLSSYADTVHRYSGVLTPEIAC